jgi:hypothetical protein
MKAVTSDMRRNFLLAAGLGGATAVVPSMRARAAPPLAAEQVPPAHARYCANSPHVLKYYETARV